METPNRPGWYDDPEDPERLRYFDGVVWTSHTTPRRTRWEAPAPRTGEGPPTGTGPGQPGPPPAGGQPGGRPAPGGWRGPGGPPPGWGPGPGGPGERRVPTTEDGQQLSSYGRRVGAYLVDGIIKAVLTSLVGIYWTLQLVQDSMDQMRTALERGDTSVVPGVAFGSAVEQYVLPLTLVSVAVNLVYNAVFLTRVAATPGKLAFGISVRSVHRPGPVGLGDALRRYALQTVLDIAGIVPALALVSSVVTLLDLAWPLGDSRRQALHDKIADTQVVRGRWPAPDSAQVPPGPTG